MLQLIVVVFFLAANGEREEQRYVYRDSFASVVACKAKGVEVTAELARVPSPDARGFAFICIENGTPV